MLRLIYRQRRRILICSFFLTLGIMVQVLNMDGFAMARAEFAPWILAVSMSVVTLIVFLGSAAVIAVSILLLPRWRLIWEQVALLVLALALIDAAFPRMSDHSLVNALLPIALIVLIVSVVHGPALDRFRLWVDHKETRRFRSARSPEDLWVQLSPAPQSTRSHWDPLLHKMDPIADEDDAFEVEYQLGHSAFEHQTITFLEKDYPHHFRYHHLGEVDPSNRSLVEGIHDVRIDPAEDGIGSVVTISEHRSALLPRVGLMMWFDDELGSRVDFMRARELNRRDWSTAGKLRRDILALS